MLNPDVLKAWQDNVDKVLAQQSPIRRRNDQDRIRHIRRLMSKSPLGRRMLHWADQNNVQILMDNQCDGSIGYYLAGTNTVCLNADYKNGQLIDTLAHELRHCWQDHNGLLSTVVSDTPQQYVKQILFAEADAFAIGYQVAYEAGTPPHNGRSKTYHYVFRRAQQKYGYKSLQNGKSVMDMFNLFFSDELNTRYQYEKHYMEIAAHALGFYQKNPERLSCSEYKKSDFQESTTTGIDMRNEEHIRKLGEVFGMYNYMDHIKTPITHSDFHQGFLSNSRRRLFSNAKRRKKQHKKNGTKNWPVYLGRT